jgi:hypothetical protein
MVTRGVVKMNAQAISLNEIRRIGIEALTEKLGIVGMIRFMQQSEIGYGDYTIEREKILGNPSIEDLYNSILNNRNL